MLQLEKLMEKKKPEDEIATRTVRMNDRIETIAEYVLRQTVPVPVVDLHDQLVGVLRQERVLHILFHESARETDS